MSLDYSDFVKMRDRLQKINTEKMLINVTNEVASRLWRRIVFKTPTDTGRLRDSWRVIRAVRRGDKIETEIQNPITYANYVEYGHRTHGGKGWIRGRCF